MYTVIVRILTLLLYC